MPGHVSVKGAQNGSKITRQDARTVSSLKCDGKHVAPSWQLGNALLDSSIDWLACPRWERAIGREELGQLSLDADAVTACLHLSPLLQL